ncbi:hypothetical protein EV189_0449 [Motilibacter rhizosphaerae]|uniref:Serine/threonine protein kinase n=1 Tax=Motilibacter rhizosphaerae TaxID=598652 RepID=A0A4Q7NVL0_9ACTN|nr:hypothetical protein EV189_0449 [Motilibacter rhizosphaerae]
MLVAGRYRLVDALGDPHAREPLHRWRAHDELLGRPVTLSIVPPGPEAAATLAGARAAALLTCASAVRVLDVLDDVPDGGHAGAVVSEWVEGEDLESVLLREGPLGSELAVSVGLAATELLAELPDPRAARLRPADVLVCPDGRVCLALDRSGYAPAAGPTPTACVAALVYAALTARWPLPGLTALPPAPALDGRTAPHHVRAGLDPRLDALVEDALGGGGPDLPGLADQLGALRRPPAPEPLPGSRRRIALVLPVVVGLVLATGLALLAWQLSRSVTRDSGTPPAVRQRSSASASPTPTPSAPAATSGVLAVAGVRAVDPFGDGTEGTGTEALVLDDDPATAWRTSAYFRRPDFGGLKRGLGLVLDLPAPASVSSVEVDMTVPGAAYEVWGSDVPLDRPPAGTPLGRVESAGLQERVPLRAGPSVRWVLLWFRSLPPARDRAGAYRAEVTTVRLTGTPAR